MSKSLPVCCNIKLRQISILWSMGDTTAWVEFKYVLMSSTEIGILYPRELLAIMTPSSLKGAITRR